MPRGPNKPSEEELKAIEMYKQGKKLIDIAKELGKPEGTVRRWKCTHNWDGTKNERSRKKKKNVQAKRGAPKGNQNSKGHSEGKGNPHPVPPLKHGGYSNVYWDTLTDEEKEMIEEMPQDEETILINQIQLFSVRERRIMKAINKYLETKEPVAIYNTSRSESKRSFNSKDEEEEYNRRIQEKVENEERLPGRTYQISTIAENKDNIIIRLESELSNVQAKKTRAIEALARLNLEKKKMDGANSGNDIVKSWAENVMKLRGGNHE